MKYTLEKEESGLFRIIYFDGIRGGLVSGPDNLSQEGSCWIGENCQVLDGSRVENDALILNGSYISGNVVVKDSAIVRGASEIFDNCRIQGTTLVNHCMLSGDITVENMAMRTANLHSSNPITITSPLDYASIDFRSRTGIYTLMLIKNPESPTGYEYVWGCASGYDIEDRLAEDGYTAQITAPVRRFVQLFKERS